MRESNRFLTISAVLVLLITALPFSAFAQDQQQGDEPYAGPAGAVGAVSLVSSFFWHITQGDRQNAIKQAQEEGRFWENRLADERTELGLVIPQMTPHVSEIEYQDALRTVQYRDHIQQERLKILEDIEKSEHAEVKAAARAYLKEIMEPHGHGSLVELQKLAKDHDRIRGDIARLEEIAEKGNIPSLEKYLKAKKVVELRELALKNPANARHSNLLQSMRTSESSLVRQGEIILKNETKEAHRRKWNPVLFSVGIAAGALSLGEVVDHDKLVSDVLEKAQRPTRSDAVVSNSDEQKAGQLK